MTFSIYKILHLIGILATFMSLGALTIHALNRGSKDHPGRKLLGMTHGIALLLVLIAGFGMIAKMKIGFPGWIWVKLVIWLILGASLAFIPKKPELAKVFWVGLIAIAGLASYLAIMKPF